jgi:hypothetical protein
MRLSREASAVEIMIGKKQLGNVECFNYLGIVITVTATCTGEIKSGMPVAKAAFSREQTLFSSKLDFILRKKVVKCCIWSVALYGTET